MGSKSRLFFYQYISFFYIRNYSKWRSTVYKYWWLVANFIFNMFKRCSPVILWPQNNCNRRFFTAERLISIPIMTYQNCTPIKEWGIHFFEVQRCRVLYFRCNFTFTANQLVVIEDTILVNKPMFRFFMVITPRQIHLRDINKNKWEEGSKFY